MFSPYENLKLNFGEIFLYDIYLCYCILVSFGGGGGGSGGGVNGINISGSRTEPLSLSTLDRDCFIIPVHSLDRFLPAGIPVEYLLHIHFCLCILIYIVFLLHSCPRHVMDPRTK